MRKKKVMYVKQPNIKTGVKGTRIACCDCGLVHDMGFEVASNGFMFLAFQRNPRATAAMRRGMFPYLKSPQSGEQWKMVRIGT